MEMTFRARELGVWGCVTVDGFEVLKIYILDDIATSKGNEAGGDDLRQNTDKGAEQSNKRLKNSFCGTPDLAGCAEKKIEDDEADKA